MLTENAFQLFGQIVFFGLIFLFLILLIALILGKILLKKNILIFPKLILFALDFFYSPLKQLARSFGFDDIMVDHIGVEIRNKINEKKFKETDNKKKIMVFPHCLRHPSCEAVLEETGLACDCCGKCAIGIIKPKAEELGYIVFIIPGSTFIKKIVKNHEFDSVLGIACYEDLNMTMMNLSKFSPQGVLLSRTGCYKTKVDVKSVLDKIGYYDFHNKNKE
ncbi:DUF116 domain-containing protein [Methanobrevibacter filiformis]|uniref:DUF116 domain-containing protein n=1 Tax=Methanobrevibacter filiformis TaxID=55758 RepID=A0A166D0D5_9EURY|nr:DUF116 domain-containing protein [Methanobrevibacter filiformis]KZX15069.1 hypothetical protein MBFIL_07450 [Methanobrevibacter filiformis]